MTQQLFTLADARKAGACGDGVNRFSEALRKAYFDRDIEQIRWSIGDVATVDLYDALICLRLLDDRRQRVAAVMPAVKRTAKHTTDQRVHDCIAAVEQWLAGDDSVELKTAAEAAWTTRTAAAREAAWAAAWAAWAAEAAAREAALAAAWAAEAAAADRETERALQRAELIAMFPRTFGEVK